MTSLENKLTRAKKEIDFESIILGEAHKLSKQELQSEIDARISIANNPQYIMDATEEEVAQIIDRVKKEASVLSLMWLSRYGEKK